MSLHGWPIPSTLARENAYPPVRVQAKNAARTVLPISGEARSTNLQTTNADDTSVHVVANGTDIPTNLLKAVGAVAGSRGDVALRALGIVRPVPNPSSVRRLDHLVGRGNV